MINNIECDDIIMKDNTSNTYSPCINYIRPHKRTYLEMLYSSNQVILNSRIDNYKLNKYHEKNNHLYENINNTEERDDYLIMNYDGFNDINKAKKNLMVKRKVEYDEEKERKWVENYYKIKNAELNKLRFGTN